MNSTLLMKHNYHKSLDAFGKLTCSRNFMPKIMTIYFTRAIISHFTGQSLGLKINYVLLISMTTKFQVLSTLAQIQKSDIIVENKMF